MRRLLIAPVVLALLVPSAGAEAGPADKLPTLAKVQTIFPNVAQLQVSTGHAFELQQDCLTLTVAASPKKSFSGYYPEPPPIGPGGAPAAAQVDVYTFKNVHKARNALKKVAGYVQTCTGPHTDGTYTNTVASLTDPGLADKSLAYSWTDTYTMPPNNIVITTNVVHVVVQRDKRVVDARYSTHSTPADVSLVTKLAKAGVKSSA